MADWRSLVAWFFGACCALGLPRAGWAATPADATTSLFVLTLWTDDSDDQADALTQALREHVQATPGFELAQSSQSFETLAIALRCPQKPDAPCLERIADQIHANDFLWGTVAKAHPGQVLAQVHRFIRGKPSIDASESYSERLKDADDPALLDVAGRLFDRLVVVRRSGEFVVRAGAHKGTVSIDGVERAALVDGVARISVPAGQHTIAVRGPGFDSPVQIATVAAGGERDLEFQISSGVQTAEAEGPLQAQASSATSGRTIVGYAAIVGGAGLLVVAGIEGLNWLSDRRANDADRVDVPSTVADVCSDPGSVPAQAACQRGKDAKVASMLGWISGAAGAALAGTGAWLVLTGAENPGGTSAAATRTRFDLLPIVSAHGQSIDVRVRF
ncbi:MAG: hypothetical protein ABSC94_21665 [Polyangiaceae bacterium]|jgi:hypothetical protein